MMSDIRTSELDLAESAAVTASLLCLAHCLLIPRAIATLPLLSGALTAFMAHLDGYTLADLIPQKQRFTTLLGVA